MTKGQFPEDIANQLQPLVDDDAFFSDLAQGIDPSGGTDPLAGLFMDLRTEVNADIPPMPILDGLEGVEPLTASELATMTSTSAGKSGMLLKGALGLLACAAVAAGVFVVSTKTEPISETEEVIAENSSSEAEATPSATSESTSSKQSTSSKPSETTAVESDSKKKDTKSSSDSDSKEPRPQSDESEPTREDETPVRQVNPPAREDETPAREEGTPAREYQTPTPDREEGTPTPERSEKPTRQVPPTNGGAVPANVKPERTPWVDRDSDADRRWREDAIKDAVDEFVPKPKPEPTPDKEPDSDEDEDAHRDRDNNAKTGKGQDGKDNGQTGD